MVLCKTKAIVIRSRPFEESSKLITFITKDFGKIVAIAKGAKRPTSKFGGRLELLTFLEIAFAKGRNLEILSQCETVETFGKIKINHETLKLAIYFLRIIDKSTEIGHNESNLFKLISLSLKKLNEGELARTVEKYFEVNFLRIGGLFRQGVSPDLLIGEHLGEDIRLWKI